MSKKSKPIEAINLGTLVSVSTAGDARVARGLPPEAVEAESFDLTDAGDGTTPVLSRFASGEVAKAYAEMGVTASPDPAGGTHYEAPGIAGWSSAPDVLAVGASVLVWPHVGDKGERTAPHAGRVVKVHMQDCVDVAAELAEGGREYTRTIAGLILAGTRGRKHGDKGTFTVVG